MGTTLPHPCKEGFVRFLQGCSELQGNILSCYSATSSRVAWRGEALLLLLNRSGLIEKGQTLQSTARKLYSLPMSPPGSPVGNKSGNY